MKMAEAFATRDKPGDKVSSGATDTQMEILALVNELTQKALLKQPRDINRFFAQYLDDKLDDREAKARREERRAKRKAKKKLKKAAIMESSVADPELGEIKKDLFLSAVSSGMQEQDPLREQISVPEAGARPGPSAPASLLDQFRGEPERIALIGHKKAVTHCCLHDDYVFTSSLDCSIRMWDLETGIQMVKLDNEKGINTFVLVPSDEKLVILAAGDDGKLVAWKIKFTDGKIKAKRNNVMPCHQPNPIRAMTKSPDGKFLATGCCFYMHQISHDNTCELSIRGTLKLWDLPDFVEWALHPKTHAGDIEYTAMRTMKQLIVNPGGSKLTRQSSSYNKFSERQEQNYGIRAVAFSPDSKVVAVGLGRPENSGAQDVHMTIVCDTEDLKTLWVQELMDAQTSGLAFSSIGSGTFQSPWELVISSERAMTKISLFLSGDAQQRLRVRQVWKSKFTEHHTGVCVASNNRVLCSALESALHLRDPLTGDEVSVHRDGHEKPVLHLSMSADGRIICSVGEGSAATVWRFDAAASRGTVTHIEDEVITSRK